MSTTHGEPDVTTTVGVRRGPVVVGVDATPASIAAVEWAAGEAGDSLPLHIVTSWTWPHLAPWLTSADRGVMEDLERIGNELVARCRKIARDAGATHITSEVREGVPARTLVDLSRHAGLVVVGTHRVGAIGRTVLGSTSSSVVAHSAAPVLVASPPRPKLAPRATGVVVGVAGIPADEATLAFAFDYAQRHDLAVQVLLCRPSAAVDRDDAERAHAWLAESVAGWRSRYLEVPARTSVSSDHPVNGLLEAAGESELIVVGRRGRHHLPGSRLGSVSLGVLHHARGPVVIVPAPDESDVAQPA